MKIETSTLIIILLLSFLPSAIYAGMFDRDPSEDRSAGAVKSASLSKAERAFIKGDYEDVILIGSAYESSRSRSDEKLQHLMGRAFLKLGRFSEARNRFSRILNYSDNDDYLDKAYIGLADSYYLEGNYGKAKSHYENLIRYFPDSDNKSIVYYRLGECYSKLKDTGSSKEYYDKLIKDYPDSLEARQLKGEKSSFVAYSVQAGSFTRWSNAKKMHDELIDGGFDAKIYTAVVGDISFYRVRVGQYGRLSDAEDMARALRNKGYAVKIFP